MGMVECWGKTDCWHGRGTRLRACGAEACAAPQEYLLPIFQYSIIPLFLKTHNLAPTDVPDNVDSRLKKNSLSTASKGREVSIVI